SAHQSRVKKNNEIAKFERHIFCWLSLILSDPCGGRVTRGGITCQCRRKTVRRLSWMNSMTLPRRRFLHLAAGAAALPIAPPVARAQAYPSRPVRLIAGTVPGSTPDIIARLIGQWLSERLNQTFVVENRPGAGANIGTEVVVRATPDGYTLLLCAAANAINATLYRNLTFNFIRDIAPVAGIARTPLVMEVNPSVPTK